jgi:hypothetical protein
MKKMKKYGMGSSVPGMKMTKSAKDANVLRMMADNAANKRAEAIQMMKPGGMTMMNADADVDVVTDTTATCAGPRCGSNRQRRKRNRINKRRIRRSRS